MNNDYISVYIRNSFECPSDYYRVTQYLCNINGECKLNDLMTKKMFRRNLDCKNRYIKKGLQGFYYIIMLIRLTFYLVRDLIYGPKYMVVQRTVIPRYTPGFICILLEEILKKTILYWDFDDEIFVCGEISKNQAQLLKNYSKNIIVTNEYLRSMLEPRYRDKTLLLPTTDGDFTGYDEKEVFNCREKAFQNTVKLVWVATDSNIPNLFNILDVLDEAAGKLKNCQNKQLELSVVCNKTVEYNVKDLVIKNIRWTRERAKKAIFGAHIGIMPLKFSEYALGKGGFKLVQYISTGLPVIASDVGFNKEVVDTKCGILVNDAEHKDGWIQSIMDLSSSWDNWSEYSTGAYERWNEKFPYEKNLNTWANLLI